VAFNDEVERRIQKRMAGANEGSQRLALCRDKGLLKHDALVAREYRFADADQAVAITHGRRDMRHLEATRLTLSHCTPEALERFQKKGLDIVGLKAPGLRTLHFLANAENTAGVHGIMGESVLFQEIL
jgi:hypothetical protein